MSQKTSIQWSDATWNHWWRKGAKLSRTSEAYWKQLLKWKSLASKDHAGIDRMRVFPSLCDWLDDEVPIVWFAHFLNLLHVTQNLDWLLLTKRPENWKKRIAKAGPFLTNGFPVDWIHEGKAPNNVWIGTSVENQSTADKRIPELLKIPAKIRFLSVEPMLEAIDLALTSDQEYVCCECGSKTIPSEIQHEDGLILKCVECGDESPQDFYKTEACLDWIIVGGESGPKARPCNVEWIRGIVRQCKSANVPCFVNQLGSSPFVNNADGGGKWITRMKHKKGGDPSEWPQDLRVRQFPEVIR